MICGKLLGPNVYRLCLISKTYYPQPLCPQGTITEGLHFSDCGDNKACFLYPRHCQAGDTHDSACVAAVSFLYREATDDYQVEMFVEPGSGPIGYIGVAFSEDAIMVIGVNIKAFSHNKAKIVKVSMILKLYVLSYYFEFLFHHCVCRL